MIGRILRSIPGLRRFQLRRLRSRLGAAPAGAEAGRVLAKLSRLAAEEAKVRYVLKAFRADAACIRELYRFLIENGAGCRPHGAYAAAAAAIHPAVLYAYLRDRGTHLAARGSAAGFADACLRHFEGGTGENFLLSMLNAQGYEQVLRGLRGRRSARRAGAPSFSAVLKPGSWGAL